MKELHRFISGTERAFYDSRSAKEVVEKIINEGSGNIGGENVTPIDLFFIPSELGYEEKLDLIAKNLRIKKDEIKQRLPEISAHWRDSKQFLRAFFNTDVEKKRFLAKEIEQIEEFDSVDSLVKTLSRATQLKKGERIGLAPLYCALANLMISIRSYNKEEFSGLLEESEYVERKLFEKDKSGVKRFHKIKEEEDSEWSRVGVLLDDHFWINAKFSYRGKSKESVIMKLTDKPEMTIMDIIKDGIGFKFEVSDRTDARRLFVFLEQHLRENFGGEGIQLENAKLFSKEEESELKEELDRRGVLFCSGENPSSGESFKSAKITGRIKIPRKGKEGELIKKRSFEIQVALIDNKNETGLTQHSVYKRVQKLSFFTRLFGSFDEKYLDAVCEEASQSSGLSKEKIKKYIIKNYLVKISSSKRAKYMSAHHFFRWERAGLIPAKLKIDKRDREKFGKE